MEKQNHKPRTKIDSWPASNTRVARVSILRPGIDWRQQPKYEPFGPYNGLINGNGVAEWRGFDQDYRLTGILDNGSSATLQGLTYSYYPTNDVQTMTNAVATSQTVGSTTTSYGYGSGSDLLATLSVGGVTTQAIGYTADGRIDSLNPGIQAPAGQYITSLSYNQDGRLAAVNTGGGALASYAYDGFEQRLAKTVSGSYGEIYQYGQDGSLLEETNASGVALADYIHLNGRPIAVLNGATLYYLHDDMLGTPQLATDSNQVVQWQASYDSFGQASVSGTVTQNLRFPGQYFDVESGWNHNGFRDYAPTLGRYLEPDPLGRLGSGNNLYAYVGDNPANLVDPLGLCPAMKAPSNATPWYKTCTATALGKGLGSAALDAIGILPEGGTVSAAFSLFHGAAGISNGTNILRRVAFAGGIISTAAAGSDLSEANGVNASSTVAGLQVAAGGFGIAKGLIEDIPVAGQVIAAGATTLDLISTGLEVAKCY